VPNASFFIQLDYPEKADCFQAFCYLRLEKRGSKSEKVFSY